MTDTLNKNTESGTGYRSPETDAEHERICALFCHGSNDYYKMFEFAKKLERERNELIDALSSVLVDTTSTYGYLESHIDAEETLNKILKIRKQDA